MPDKGSRQGVFTPRTFQTELRGRQSINQQIRAANVREQFDITPVSVSSWRDVVLGDGTVTVADLYDLSTAASGSSWSRLETAQIGNYLGGSICTASAFAFKPEVPNGTVEVGYGRDNADNGMWLQWNSDDTYEFHMLRDGVKTIIPQSDWTDENDRVIKVENENDEVIGDLYGFNPATGKTTGPDGVTLDITRGQQYQFSISWGGPMLFSMDSVDRSGQDHSVPLFMFDPTDGEPVMTQPNHPVYGEIRNDGVASSDTLFIGSRQFIQYGTGTPSRRKTETLNAGKSIGTTNYVPLIAFRRKTPNFEGVTLNASDIEIQTDNTIHVIVEKDPTFNTAGTWSTPTQHTASETAIEVQNNPDVQVDGDKWGGFIAGSGKNVRSIARGSNKDMPIPRNQPIVIYGKSLTGNTASADISMTIDEFW